MKELIERLKRGIYYLEGNQLEMDEYSFLDKEGLVISGNEAKEIIEVLEVNPEGENWETTRQHAMAGRLPDGSRQDKAQAIAATNAHIQKCINSGNLAGAIHAIQDLATPGHAGKPWEGFGFGKTAGEKPT